MTTAVPRKDQRFEFRISSEDRELFERAAAAVGEPMSTFATDELRIAALRVLADRTVFQLSPVESALLEELMDRPARDLPGLRSLMERPSPFAD